MTAKQARDYVRRENAKFDASLPQRTADARKRCAEIIRLARRAFSAGGPVRISGPSHVFANQGYMDDQIHFPNGYVLSDERWYYNVYLSSHAKRLAWVADQCRGNRVVA
jgi:hypothetical protein